MGAEQGDVRGFDQLKAVIANGVTELGRSFLAATNNLLRIFQQRRHTAVGLYRPIARWL